jgi:hypothetical protein
MSHGIGQQSADPSAAASSITSKPYLLGASDDKTVGECFFSE